MVATEELFTPEHHSAIAEAQSHIERIVDAESVVALTEAFGRELPPYYNELHTTRKLMWLKGFANADLDIRKKSAQLQGESKIERSAVKIEDFPFTPAQEQAVMAFTQEFAMEGESNATGDHYGMVSVLGGANQSNLLRVRHAKRQFERGVTSPYLLLLGSGRQLKDAEKQSTANYASGAETEFDLLCGALETEFEVKDYDEKIFDTDGRVIDPQSGEASSPDVGKARYYKLPNGTTALAVSAPKVEGDMRANTPDTYHFVSAIMGKDRFREMESMLVVSTDLYVPFQHADAMRLLAIPEGLKVETIGYGGVNRPPQAYASEINAAINKAHQLDETLWKIEDLQHVVGQSQEANNAVADVEDAKPTPVRVGEITLYVARQAMLRQAELDKIVATFDDRKVKAMTIEEINNQISWMVEHDLEHGVDPIGDPEFFSPYAFAAQRGIKIKEAA